MKTRGRCARNDFMRQKLLKRVSEIGLQDGEQEKFKLKFRLTIRQRMDDLRLQISARVITKPRSVCIC